ncbi:MAG: uracil-DNA glycosylase [Aquiluna sp.]
MLDSVHPDWLPLISAQKSRLNRIFEQLKDEDFVPQPTNIFRAFQDSPKSFRVLILGQDPYPNPAHAIGLAFAVPGGTKPFPPSLQNILTELQDDLNLEIRPSSITHWQDRGVMLLNRHLTTKANETGGHFQLGWDEFTLAAVKFLVAVRKEKLVAILWGNKAQELKSELGAAKVISSAHPSPLSAYRGFFGSRPFTKANQLLEEMGEAPMEWVDHG